MKKFILFTFFALTKFAQASGPVIYLPLDPSTNTIQMDLSGNGNNAFPIGMPLASNDAPNIISPDLGSLFFNGGINSILISSDTHSSVIAGTWALSFWFKVMAPLNGSSQILINSRQPNQYGFSIFMTSISLHLGLGDGTKFLIAKDYPYNFTTGQWYSFILQVTPNGNALYVNGNLIENDAYAGIPILKDSNHWLYVGNKTVGSSIPAISYFDEFRAYDRVLEPDEISLLSATIGFVPIPQQTTYVLTQDQYNSIKQRVWLDVFQKISNLDDSFFVGSSTIPIKNTVSNFPLFIPTYTSTDSFCLNASSNTHVSWNEIFKLNVINGLLSKSVDDVSWPFLFFDSLDDVNQQ